MPTDPPAPPGPPARLQWWANTRTCLADIAVELTPPADGPGTGPGTSWDASPHPLLDAEAENLAFLLAADPWFTLVHPDGTTAEVKATHTPENPTRLRLTPH